MIRCKHPLTAYRERNGLGKADLARLLGVTRASVTRWESGARQPARILVAAISKKTGIPIRVLRPDLADLVGAA